MDLSRRLFCATAFIALALVGCSDVPETDDSTSSTARVPAWASDAVFYQVFPTRFANGDPTNDPTRQTLEKPIDDVPASWSVTPWTRDWYEEAEWEQEMGGFYTSVYERRYGGDLQGVIDRLDYIDSLGVNALYFNPVFWANTLHKYDGNSFHHIDPNFGPDPEGDRAMIAKEDPMDPSTWRTTAADSLFFELLGKAHARDIRVVIDGVFNHTGRDFFAFQDVRENQSDSPYAGWYKVSMYDDPATPDTSEFDYEGWWGVPQLPEFADSEGGDDLAEGPKQYIFDSTTRWMDPNGDGDPSDGIDGWRLDVADEVPEGFWVDWNEHVRSINPEAYTVAETWQPAAGFIQAGGFSAAMNYFAFAFPVKGFLIDNVITPTEFADMIDARRTAFDDSTQTAVQNLVDSHDTPRLATMIVNRSDTGYVKPDRFDYDWGAVVSVRDNRSYKVRAPNGDERDLQRLVTLFQMTYVGAPMVYHGTEAGMWGADDPDNRKPMVWDDLDYDVEDDHPFEQERPSDPVGVNQDLLDFYRRAIQFRRNTPALRTQLFQTVQADDERNMFAYARGRAANAVVVVLNRNEEAHSMRLPLPDSLRGDYDAALSTVDSGTRVQNDGSALLLELPAYSGLALTRQ
ncbi:alpha-amylase [Longibacter salinarum]|uniref:Alpha-amylase n=1 Tax=Longibacter salinarum TaxID=1850348 RepID=A0A2A8CXJ5_9BACT|nr:alpha-amylase family glycosyl hydrolase [Longibacter salinarum]PEN13432.1 alpha-amylase [Longibacter salinarum]